MRDSVAQVRDGVGPMRNDTWSTFLNKFDVINKGASALTDELDHSLTEGLDNFVAEPAAIAADAITLPELLRTKLDHDVARDFDALNKMFLTENNNTDKTVSASVSASASAPPPPSMSASASPSMSAMVPAVASATPPSTVSAPAQPIPVSNTMNAPTSVAMSTGAGNVAPGGSVAASPAMSTSATGAPAPSVPTSASGAITGATSGGASSRTAAAAATAIDARITAFNDMLDSVLKRFDDQRAVLASPRPTDVAQPAPAAEEMVLAALSSGSGLRQ